MLADKSIKRDIGAPFLLKVVLKLRKITSHLFRSTLNNKMKRQLEGIEFTLLGNNCLPGVVYHDLGREFTSPTVNLAFDGEDFIKFLENPKHYFECDMEFFNWEGIDYPLAKIDDIEVRFVHYKTPEEAKRKWHERSQRIVWDNIFIVATNHDGMCQDKWMERFDKLPYKNKIMFVSKEYPQYDWAVLVPQFKGRFQVRIMTSFANFFGKRYYETCFDIPKWIKESSKKATGN